MARDVLLIGSIPLGSAREVFAMVANHLTGVIHRIPDGEQIGWSGAVRRSLKEHPDFEVDRQVPLNAMGKDKIDLFRLKPGRDPRSVKLGPYGYADNAIRSYAAFKDLQNAGIIAAGVKYQVTLPGPGTSTYFIQLPADVLLPLAREALWREVEAILAAVPREDIAIQIDVAMEAEHEEYLRRPEAFDQPLHKTFDWSLDQMSTSVAWLADRIPPQVELGFHICSIWHHDPRSGQDNKVLADITNAIMGKIKRGVDYVHIPLVPAHTEADIAELRALNLQPDTHLYLGLINLADGLEGAKRRVQAAERHIGAFGVSAFCGLGRPPTTLAKGPSTHVAAPIPELQRASAATIGAVLDLHRQVAQL